MWETELCFKNPEVLRRKQNIVEKELEIEYCKNEKWQERRKKQMLEFKYDTQLLNAGEYHAAIRVIRG